MANANEFTKEYEDLQSRERFRSLEQPPEPDKDSQQRIIKVLATGNTDFLKQADVRVSDAERTKFNKMAHSYRREGLLEEFINEIHPTYELATPKRTWHEMERYEHFDQIKTIIATALHPRFIKDDYVPAEVTKLKDYLYDGDMDDIVKEYPNPAMLGTKMKALLDLVEQNNSANKRDQYEKSLRVFLRSVYGMQQKYCEQFDLLAAEAAKAPVKKEQKKPALLTVDAVIDKGYNESDPVPAESRRTVNKFRRGRDAEVFEEIKEPVLNISGKGDIPLIIDGDSKVEVAHIPAGLNTTGEYLQVISQTAGRTKALYPEADKDTLRRKVITTFQPNALASIEGAETPEAFRVKNEITKILLEKEDVNTVAFLKREGLM